MRFDSLNLSIGILKGIHDAKFESCTPIQEQSLPECLEGLDLIAQSQTGTGKTAVFLLTIFHKLTGADSKPSKKPRALIMAPTRELAVQIEKEAQVLGKHLPLTSIAVYGGVEYDKQVGAFRDGVDIVVATPGRFIDLYKGKTIPLDDIEVFVVDEADRMFDMGFAPDISYIASRLPKKKPRQTLLFSATIDSNVRRLAERYMKPDPIEIEIDPDQLTVEAIDQKVIYVSNDEKIPSLMSILSREGVDKVIVFTNMKRTAEEVEWKLKENGFPARVLTGDVTQARRQKTIDGMKSGEVKILVATDVAASGLHIANVTHVINYDLPEDAASYVHRIGRTARAGKSGTAYSLGCETYVVNLPEIEKYIEHKIEKEWIEESELVKDKSGSYRARRRPASRDARTPEKRGGRRDSSERRPSDKRRASSGGARKSSEVSATEEKRTHPKESPKESQREQTKPADETPKKEAAASEKKPEKVGEKKEVKREGAEAAGAEGTRPRRRRRRRRSGERTTQGDTKASSSEKKPKDTPKERNDTQRKSAKEGGDGRTRQGRGAGKGSQRRSSSRGRSERTGLHPSTKRPEDRAGSSENPEDRLAYYRKKYGEEVGAAGEKKKKGGLLKRITSVFRRKET